MSLVQTAIPEHSMLEELDGMSYEDIRSLVADTPEEAAQAIVELMRETARLRGDIGMLEQLLG